MLALARLPRGAKPPRELGPHRPPRLSDLSRPPKKRNRATLKPSITAPQSVAPFWFRFPLRFVQVGFSLFSLLPLLYAIPGVVSGLPRVARIGGLVAGLLFLGLSAALGWFLDAISDPNRKPNEDLDILISLLPRKYPGFSSSRK